MTDLATAEAPAVSTTLEPNIDPSVSGGGTPSLAPDEKPEPKPEPKSLRDTIAGVVKQADESAKDAQAEPDAKPDPAKGKAAEEKAEPADAKEAPKGPERGADGKFAGKGTAKADAAESAEPKADAKADLKPGTHIEAPKNFLPDAKETWRNTPRAVQRDVENAFKQHEAEVAQHREAAERYAAIKPYDDYVRQNGRAGVHETLQEVAQLEDLVAKNPVAALNQVLLRAGPRKADGSPVSLYELAQYVVQSGQDGYNRMAAQQPQQQQQEQPNPEIAQLKAQLAQIQEQQLAATVIEPFKAANPRYDELEGDIAFFLQSGKIPTSLSPSDRLAAAYDMAARINPASHEPAPASQTDLEPARRADESFSAGKSIKSAPGAITPTMEPTRGRSTADILRAEMKKAKVS